jgi:hypothetical protein
MTVPGARDLKTPITLIGPKMSNCGSSKDGGIRMGLSCQGGHLLTGGSGPFLTPPVPGAVTDSTVRGEDWLENPWKHTAWNRGGVVKVLRAIVSRGTGGKHETGCGHPASHVNLSTTAHEVKLLFSLTSKKAPHHHKKAPRFIPRSLPWYGYVRPLLHFVGLPSPPLLQPTPG